MTFVCKKILLLLLMISLVIAQDCNSPFYNATYFQTIGMKRPRYLAVPRVSSDLTYCKMFNDKSSCCNKDTDNDIGTFFDSYKLAVAEMAGVKIRGFKKVFTDYEKIKISGQDSTEIQNEITKEVTAVKAAMAETNK